LVFDSSRKTSKKGSKGCRAGINIKALELIEMREWGRGTDVSNRSSPTIR